MTAALLHNIYLYTNINTSPQSPAPAWYINIAPTETVSHKMHTSWTNERYKSNPKHIPTYVYERNMYACINICWHQAIHYPKSINIRCRWLAVCWLVLYLLYYKSSNFSFSVWENLDCVPRDECVCGVYAFYMFILCYSSNTT